MKKLTKHQIIIGLSYSFCAVNCIMLGIVSTIAESDPDMFLFGLGLIFTIMIPISVLDPRKEMRGQLAAVFAIVLHILFCILVSLLCFKLWLVASYILESIILLVLEFTHRNINCK